MDSSLHQNKIILLKLAFTVFWWTGTDERERNRSATAGSSLFYYFDVPKRQYVTHAYNLVEVYTLYKFGFFCYFSAITCTNNTIIFHAKWTANQHSSSSRRWILSNYLPLHIVICDATGAKPRPANVSQFNSYVRLIYGIFGARTGKCV